MTRNEKLTQLINIMIANRNGVNMLNWGKVPFNDNWFDSIRMTANALFKMLGATNATEAVSCGFAGCVVGWMPIAFPRHRIFYETEPGGGWLDVRYIDGSGQQWSGTDVFAKVMDVEFALAFHICRPEEYARSEPGAELNMTDMAIFRLKMLREMGPDKYMKEFEVGIYRRTL
jgi:hypothetical protein